MSGQRIAVLSCAIVGLLATFLPWIHVPIMGSVPGTKGDGWITFALFLPAFIIALSGQKEQDLAGKGKLGAIIPALIASVIGIWKIVDLNSAMGSSSNNPFAKALSQAVSIGIGLYLVIIAGLLLAILSQSMGKKRSSEDALSIEEEVNL